MAESQSSSSGPLLQECSGSPHVLEVVQRRAKKASNYYHHVLANGNFRRDSDDSENRRSENSDQKCDFSDPTDNPKGIVRSQPTTPVRVPRAKGSPAWVKAANYVDDESLTSNRSDKFRTFPGKIRAQDRMHDSSKSRKPLSMPGQHNKLHDKTNLAAHQAGSFDRLNNITRSSEDAKKYDNQEEHASSSPTKAQSDYKKSDLDYTIAYTLPNSRPKRQQSHYYETVELPHQQRERNHYYETVELPAKKEKTHNYEVVQVSTTSPAVSGLRPTASTGNLKSHSASSSPRKYLNNQQRRASGEMYGLDAVSGKKSSNDSGELGKPSAEIKRHKHHTFSVPPDHATQPEVKTSHFSINTIQLFDSRGQFYCCRYLVDNTSCNKIVNTYPSRLVFVKLHLIHERIN